MRLPTISLFSALVLLGGCLGDPGAGSQPALGDGANGQPAVEYLPKPGLSAKERKREAINLLQVGNAGQAKAELQAYLAERPRNEQGQDLLKQIDADPIAYLGAKHFSYKMKPGDSLSGIAKRALGDPLKFHILARYNGIDNPSKIEAGQVIKVPGNESVAEKLETAAAASPSEPSETADEQIVAAPVTDQESALPEVEEVPSTAFTSQEQVEETTAAISSLDSDVSGSSEIMDTSVTEVLPEPSTTLDDPAASEEQLVLLTPAVEPDGLASPGEVLNEAEALAQEGNFEGAIELYEQGMIRYPDDPLLRQFAAANYETYAGQLENKGRRGEAEGLLNKAQELDPQSATIKEKLIAYARQEEADEWYHVGTTNLATDKRIEAYDAFRKAVSIVPDHTLANQKLIDLAPAVTEDYHRQALTAFRRQELEPAIGLWDKALEIDPNYAPALLYREQAIDLKKKLEGIKE